jgi:hypothetical protein
MTDTPKLWRDMTPEEKGALLLAHHEGQSIQSFGVFVPDMWWGDLPEWEDKVAYRVKPEPKRETMMAKLCIDARCTSLHMRPDYCRGEYGYVNFYFSLTFDTIDGKLDPASIKIEEM